VAKAVALLFLRIAPAGTEPFGLPEAALLPCTTAFRPTCTIGGYGAYAPYAYSPDIGNPYSGYGAGYADGGGYSYGPSSSSYGFNPYLPAATPRGADESSLSPLLAASAVPTEEGRPAWPLALRILPGQEAQALRGRIDALLQIAGTQLVQNPAIGAELAQATSQLRRLLIQHRDERGGLAEYSYDEARRFLDNLGRLPRLLLNN
jgi:hypothetical protein